MEQHIYSSKRQKKKKNASHEHYTTNEHSNMKEKYFPKQTKANEVCQPLSAWEEKLKKKLILG